MSELHAVTGAFGYSGRYIARRLLDAGHRVITLTNRQPRDNPFGDRVRACPLDFDRVERLAESLRGVSALHNTYWVRFNINNIARMLRRFPVFGVFGDGEYRLQPIYVDDLAALAVEQSVRRDDTVIDAIGPETFTCRELVATIGRIIDRPRAIVSVPPALGYCVGWATGIVVRDVVVTREEIEGLMANLLCVDAPPAGTTRLTDWAERHKDTLGVRYASNEGSPGGPGPLVTCRFEAKLRY